MTDALSAWIREFPAAVTVCDRDGIILEMNDKSARTFASDGGYDLVGRNLLDCRANVGRAIDEYRPVIDSADERTDYGRRS